MNRHDGADEFSSVSQVFPRSGGSNAGDPGWGLDAQARLIEVCSPIPRLMSSIFMRWPGLVSGFFGRAGGSCSLILWAVVLWGLKGGHVRAEEPNLGNPQAVSEVMVVGEWPSLLRTGAVDREHLLQSPARSLDGVLREVPGFSLFRRSDSLIAHPTSQGASFGNTGPNGASRVVVLEDGVPMNDPFGGWIPWSRFPGISIAKVTLTPNGRPGEGLVGPFCGSLAIQTRFLEGAPFVAGEVSAGNRMRVQSGWAFAEDVQDGRSRWFGSVGQTDFRGYPVVRESQRGVVDRRATMRAESFEAGVRRYLSAVRDWSLTVRMGGWQEKRNNGTPLGVNRAEALDFSAQLEHRSRLSDWSGVWTVFHQRRDFGSTFTSVAANRASETLTLEQFSVPAVATGWLQQARVALGSAHVLTVGSDLRWVEGETREFYQRSGAVFLRERVAGGVQWDFGLSAADRWAFAPGWTLSPGGRLGMHRDADGRLREWNRQTGIVGNDRRYEERTSVPWDAGVSLRWAPQRAWEWEAAIFSNHRQPSLNELYRPFRVGNTLTLANAGLRAEVLRGIDTALLWKPVDGVRVRGRLFWNELRHAIANVSQVTGPGNFGDWGSLAAGAIGARRENLDAVEIRGLELGLEGTLAGGVEAEVRWQHSQAAVRRAEIQRGLEGRVPAQFPGEVVFAAVRGEWERWRWRMGARWVSGQYEDDLNQRRLSGALTFDGLLARRIGRSGEVFVGIENLTGVEVQTRRDPDGTIGVSFPRSWVGGVRWEF